MLRIHFLNVGHGDCTVIEHPSRRITMVDCNASRDYDGESFLEFLLERRSRLPSYNALSPSGFGGGFLGSNPLTGALAPSAAGFLSDYFSGLEESKKELTDPVEFMRRVYPGRRLWRFVLTHPDLDHMRGLMRLRREIGIDNFWDIVGHTKETPDFRGDDDRADWRFYQQLRAGSIASLPARRFHPGDALFAFGRDEAGALGGDSIEILSPTDGLVHSCNAAEKSNDLSYVLRVWHAGKSVLLPGDAEDESWDGMRAAYGTYLKSDILKASHHGRDSGYNLDALKLIAPSAVVVSVGRKPATDASSKYYAQSGWVMSTRYYGDIELRIHDDGQWQWFVQRNADR